MTTKCERCDNDVGEQGKRFCSTTCWYAFTKERRTVPCEVCKTPFERKVKSTRACSVACGNELKRVDKQAICACCGVGFKRPHGKKQTFCTRSCAMKDRNRIDQRTHAQGALIKHGAGYVQQKVGPKWIMQHRLVMETKIGRPLEANEHVHHMNGIRDDNRPENLELWSGRKDPPGQRVMGLARDMLRKLTPEQRRALLENIEE